MLALLILVAGVVGYSILNGWVTSVLWGWFLVPLGVPAIGVANAIGFALLVGLFLNRSTYTPSGEQDKETALARLFGAVLLPFVALGLGWIIHQFQ